MPFFKVKVKGLIFNYIEAESMEQAKANALGMINVMLKDSAVKGKLKFDSIQANASNIENQKFYRKAQEIHAMEISETEKTDLIREALKECDANIERFQKNNDLIADMWCGKCRKFKSDIGPDEHCKMMNNYDSDFHDFVELENHFDY